MAITLAIWLRSLDSWIILDPNGAAFWSHWRPPSNWGPRELSISWCRNDPDDPAQNDLMSSRFFRLMKCFFFGFRLEIWRNAQFKYLPKNWCFNSFAGPVAPQYPVSFQDPQLSESRGFWSRCQSNLWLFWKFMHPWQGTKGNTVEPAWILPRCIDWTMTWRANH